MIAFLFAAAQAVVAVPATADGRMCHYVVRPGDSLSNLASRFLNSSRAINQVANESSMGRPRKLRIGETLIIPYRIMRSAPVGGKVVALRGRVQINTTAATPGMVVAEGSRVATAGDASVSIQFPDGTIASLPSNSTVSVRHLRRYLLTSEVDRSFTVESGSSEWRVTPATRPGDRFDVGTPVAVSAVRGTEFRVSYAPDAVLSGTSVVKGEVGLTTQASPEPVALPKGFGAVSDPSGKVDKRVLLTAPGLAAGYGSQRRETMAFEATPVAGAASYAFVIAIDSGFIDRVAEQRSATPRVEFHGLDDRNYFIRVSALDNGALEGFSKTFGFERRTTAIKERIDHGVSDAFEFSWLAGGAGPAIYRFTLGLDPALAKPLIDVPGIAETRIDLTALQPGIYYWRVRTSRFEDGAYHDKDGDIEKLEVGAR